MDHTRAYKLTPYGFEWGPAIVTRVCEDKKHGVWIQVAGKRQSVEIRVTNSGKLRVGAAVNTTHK